MRQGGRDDAGACFDLPGPWTDSPGCADFPEGLPSEREGGKHFSTGFGLPLDKSLSPRVLTCLFFCVCIMQGQGRQRVHREASEWEARGLRWPGLGPRRAALTLYRSQVPPSLCRAGTKGSRSQVARKRTPMQFPKGEGENGYWASLSTFRHTLFPWATPLFI